MIVEEPKKDIAQVSAPEPESLPVPTPELVPLSSLVDDIGFIPTESSAPTESPTRPLRKFKIIDDGAGKIKLAIYDTKNKRWLYTANLTTTF